MMLYHLREVSRRAAAVARSASIPARDRHAGCPRDARRVRTIVLFHDDLAPVNDPVWFRDFVAHAARHGLQFLGEARGAAARPARSEDGAVSRFRRHAVVSPVAALPGGGDAESRRHVRAHAALSVLGWRTADAVESSVTAALADAYPLPLPFEELLPYDADPADTLFALWQRGAVDLHVFDFPCEETVTERPRATQAGALSGGAVAFRHERLPSSGRTRTSPIANSCSGSMAAGRCLRPGSSGSREWAYWRGRETR